MPEKIEKASDNSILVTPEPMPTEINFSLLKTQLETANNFILLQEATHKKYIDALKADRDLIQGRIDAAVQLGVIEAIEENKPIA